MAVFQTIFTKNGTMAKKFKRSEQDKPLGGFGDTKRPKDINPTPKTINDKTNDKDKNKQ